MDSRTQDAGRRMQDTGCKTQDARRRTQDATVGGDMLHANRATLWRTQPLTTTKSTPRRAWAPRSSYAVDFAAANSAL